MRFLSLFIFLLFCAYALVARWYFVCQIRGLCGEEQQVEDIRLKTLKLTEGDSVILQGYDQFAFDSPVFSPGSTATTKPSWTPLRYPPGQPRYRNMTITAFYRASEKGTSSRVSSKISVLARADQIRKLLMKRGIDQVRISLDHGLSEDAGLKEPCSSVCTTPTISPGTLKRSFYLQKHDLFRRQLRVQLRRVQTRRTLQAVCRFRQNVLRPQPRSHPAHRRYTDSIASADYNLDLGMRRYQSARDYFRAMGIEAKIVVESQGEER
ncbi:MAG: hypothetical protein H6559_21630 [Lewinellaceae bacterium]|nr:hypothetical protein [Lewinellaceae bacterium]